jgi:lysyl-tRNA synthetase, class II
MSIISESISGKTIDVIIQSTNLKSASYDTESEVLTIVFNNGSIYEYEKVPWNIFTKFRLSESQGKYFNTNISKNYKYKKVNE